MLNLENRIKYFGWPPKDPPPGVMRITVKLKLYQGLKEVYKISETMDVPYDNSRGNLKYSETTT